MTNFTFLVVSSFDHSPVAPSTSACAFSLFSDSSLSFAEEVGVAEGTVGLAVSTLGVVQLPPAVAPGVGESFTEVTVSGRAELAFTLVAVSETAAEIAEKFIFKKGVKNMKTIKFLTSCEMN